MSLDSHRACENLNPLNPAVPELRRLVEIFYLQLGFILFTK